MSLGIGAALVHRELLDGIHRAAHTIHAFVRYLMQGVQVARLAIRLLGEFGLAVDGASIHAIQPGRQQELLGYLLLHRGTSISRRHLAFLFWPESSEAQAHANLRNLLHFLRRALPGSDEYLHLESRSIAWRSEQPLNFDVATFEEALARAAAAQRTGDSAVLRHALEHAVEVYQGDLFPGCYEEWLLSERERLREHFTIALDQLISVLEQAREYAAAISCAQRLLRHDPLHETSYRRLMTLHAANGERAAALRTYHACVTVLERELGVEPQAATQAVYARLLESTGLMTEQTVAPVSTAPLMVGRQTEWSALLDAWRAATAGKPQAFIVYGEAGIGKSRLLEELRHWAAQQGATTLNTRSYAAEGALAYAPVIDWLRSPALQAVLPALDSAWQVELVRLLPEFSAVVPAEPSQQWSERLRRLHLHEALVRVVLQARPPLLLVIDDLQWCDQETIEWLHFLLRSASQAPLLLLGAARPEELGEQHPLHPFLVDLRSAGTLTEIELAPLTAEECAQLAAQISDRRLPLETLQGIFRTSEGSPLFIVELMRNRLLDFDRGVRQDSAPPSSTTRSARLLPTRLHAVIEARLDRLTPAARELAVVASVCGRAFTFGLLSIASEQDDAAIVRGLDELWRRRLVRELGVDAYDFSHDAIREVAYADIGPAWRRRLHGRVADALELVHVHDLDAVSAELAVHCQYGGRPAQALTWYQRAGAVAAARFDHLRSAAYLAAALSLLDALPPEGDRITLEFSLLIAQIGNLVVTEGFTGPQMLKTFERIAAIKDDLKDQRLRFVAVRDLRWYSSATGDMNRSLDHAKALMHIALQIEEREHLIEANLGLAIVYRYIGDQVQARKHFDRAQAIASTGASRKAVDEGSDANALPDPGIPANLALTLWLLGYPEQALAASSRALAEAEKLNKPFETHIAQFFASVLYRHMHDVERVAVIAPQFSALGKRYDIRIAAFDDLSIEGWLEAAYGNAAAGIPKMRAGIDAFLVTGHRQLLPHRLTLLLEAQVGAGEHSAAAATLAEALALTAQTGEHLWDAELHRLHGELLCATAAPAGEILAAFDHAIAVARGQQARILELRATVALCRYLQSQGRSAEALTRLAPTLAWFTEGFGTPDLREASSMLDSLQP